MQTRYPYAAPRANVAGAESGDDYGEIKILSASGRLAERGRRLVPQKVA